MKTPWKVAPCRDSEIARARSAGYGYVFSRGIKGAGTYMLSGGWLARCRKRSSRSSSAAASGP